jgi:hypothetical protein
VAVAAASCGNKAATDTEMHPLTYTSTSVVRGRRHRESTLTAFPLIIPFICIDHVAGDSPLSFLLFSHISVDLDPPSPISLPLLNVNGSIRVSRRRRSLRDLRTKREACRRRRGQTSEMCHRTICSWGGEREMGSGNPPFLGAAVIMISQTRQRLVEINDTISFRK